MFLLGSSSGPRRRGRGRGHRVLAWSLGLAWVLILGPELPLWLAGRASTPASASASTSAAHLVPKFPSPSIPISPQSLLHRSSQKAAGAPPRASQVQIGAPVDRLSLHSHLPSIWSRLPSSVLPWPSRLGSCCSLCSRAPPLRRRHTSTLGLSRVIACPGTHSTVPYCVVPPTGLIRCLLNPHATRSDVPVLTCVTPS